MERLWSNPQTAFSLCESTGKREYKHNMGCRGHGDIERLEIQGERADA